MIDSSNAYKCNNLKVQTVLDEMKDSETSKVITIKVFAAYIL
jgi:hypothetical protein